MRCNAIIHTRKLSYFLLDIFLIKKFDIFIKSNINILLPFQKFTYKTLFCIHGKRSFWVQTFMLFTIGKI